MDQASHLAAAGGRRPWRLFAAMLVSVAVAEALAMAALHLLLPHGLTFPAVLAADVLAVTVVALPCAWAWVLRPLMEDQRRFALLGTALATAGNGIFITDRKGFFVWANPAFCRLSGYDLPELVGQRPSLLKSGHHDEAFYTHMWRTIVQGGTWRAETVDRRKDGNLFVVMQTIAPIRDETGAITHYVAVHEDITQRKEAEARVHRLAHHDTLTDLPNRLLFFDRLEQSIARCRRDGSGLALMFLDLDRFKQVNDRLGHHVGDSLLRATAMRLRDCVRASDTVARLAGDEFTIILAGTHGLSDIRLVADKVVAALGRPFELDEQVIQVGTSIGIAVFPGDGETGDALLRRADAAMYEAKRQGGGRWVFADGSGDLSRVGE